MKISLSRNILANYASQCYITLVGILMVPLYIRYMGVEAYGLVGFFAMLQAWFQLLDLGLSPTIARETARFNGGATDAVSLRRLLRCLEGIFIGIAVLGAAAMIGGARFIAGTWLQVQQLPLAEVENAIMLMALIIALRWVAGMYRGAVSGSEQLTWLGCFNSAVATARFVLVIPFFVVVGASPTQFFSFQLAVAFCEVAILIAKVYSLVPAPAAGARIRWQWGPLRQVMHFSLSIAYTTSMWIVATQADKLLLSKLLPLADYGYFTLAVLVATGVMMIGTPISAALIPRLIAVNARNDEREVVRLYRLATQLVAVGTISSGLVIAFFSEQVLWLWTADVQIAQRAAPVLSLYAAGYAISSLSAFPSYLQVAKGDLRLHVIGSTLFMLVLIPALFWATRQHGVVGAGYAWLAANSLYFLLWVPVVHKRFFKGLHYRWLFGDIGMIALTVLLSCLLMKSITSWPASRMDAGVVLFFISMTTLIVAALSSSLVRARLRTIVATFMPPPVPKGKQR